MCILCSAPPPPPLAPFIDAQLRERTCALLSDKLFTSGRSCCNRGGVYRVSVDETIIVIIVIKLSLSFASSPYLQPASPFFLCSNNGGGPIFPSLHLPPSSSHHGRGECDALSNRKCAFSALCEDEKCPPLLESSLQPPTHPPDPPPPPPQPLVTRGVEIPAQRERCMVKIVCGVNGIVVVVVVRRTVRCAWSFIVTIKCLQTGGLLLLLSLRGSLKKIGLSPTDRS